MNMGIEGLSAESVKVEPIRNLRAVSVDLKGVSGSDFVACADDELIKEILDTLGEDYVVEHFDIRQGAE